MPTASDSILIRNIFYMIAYATGTMGNDARTLLTTCPTLMSDEEFGDLSELFADILVSATRLQKTRGFDSSYFPFEDDLGTVRGRIRLNRSIQLKARGSMLLRCSYDEFSINTYMNQVIKTTIRHLLKISQLPPARRKGLREALLMLSDVETLPSENVDWSFVRYTKQNQSYRFLMSICRIILEHRIPLTGYDNANPLPSLLDEQRLSSLFQNFVKEYYRKHYKRLNSRATVIKTGIERPAASLPALETDVVLNGPDLTLIIDTKCYGTILKAHFGKRILSPEHRNQILSYVLHEGVNPKPVEGMLLYAESSLEDPVNIHWKELGHSFNARTIDLNLPFDRIAAQLNQIGDALLIGKSPTDPA